METIRNIHFTQLIRVNNRMHEFNFRKRGENRYDGDVSDALGTRHFFTLVKENENWTMSGPGIAEWLHRAEEDVIKCIGERH